MSMKIERSSLDQVKKRFETNKKKMEEKKKDYDLEQRLRELKEEVNKFIQPCILPYKFKYLFFFYLGREVKRI